MSFVTDSVLSMCSHHTPHTIYNARLSRYLSRYNVLYYYMITYTIIPSHHYSVFCRVRINAFNFGATMVQPWCNHGATMVQPWCNHGATLVQPWCRSGATLVHPWCNPGATMMPGLFHSNPTLLRYWLGEDV